MKSKKIDSNQPSNNDGYDTGTDFFVYENQQEGYISPNCVAICSVGELFGGVERHILGMLNELSACGVQALLILFHDGELAEQARQQDFKPIILPSSNRSILKISFGNSTTAISFTLP